MVGTGDAFWYDEKSNEINLHKKSITVNIGGDKTVYIDKLYGPMIFCEVRVTPVVNTCTWKVERLRISQDENGNDVQTWETVCEFDAQECISFRED